MNKSTKHFLSLAFYASAVGGSIYILSFRGGEGGAGRILPMSIIALYGLFLMKGISIGGGLSAMKRIDSLFPMGLLFTVLSIFSLLIHLKASGADLAAPEAAAMALSYLFMALTSSMSALALRFVAWRLFPEECESAGITEERSYEKDWYIPA